MKPQYNTEELIKTIKRACSVPTSQLTYTPADFSALANDCLQTQVVPLMMSAREDYFVDHIDILSTADGVIPFPENAVGSKLRNVCYVQQSSPLVLINLPRVDLDVVAGVGFYNINTLAGFYLEGNDLVLYPNTSVPVNTTLRMYYYKRTLVLAPPESYAQVQSVDPDTNTIVLDFVPYAWEVGTIVNSVSSTPNFSITNEAMEITALSSPSIILDSVDGIEEGDYISEEGYSAIPQVPIEAHNYLAQLTAVKALEGLGDKAGMESAAEVAKVLKESLLVMVSQRVDGSVKKVINPSGGLRLGAGIGRRGWGW